MKWITKSIKRIPAVSYGNEDQSVDINKLYDKVSSTGKGVDGNMY